ncbi:hypothetical protein HYW72_01020 [Candidatus Nomurabacteria bacterium]|nr:hypothetical protein [Candidatus Nomurabacteria bacterium]
MNTITVSKNKIEKEGGVVLLSLREYRKIQMSSMPIYYLQSKEARNLDKLVKNGLKSYKDGKTKVLKSFADFD